MATPTGCSPIRNGSGGPGWFRARVVQELQLQRHRHGNCCSCCKLTVPIDCGSSQGQRSHRSQGSKSSVGTDSHLNETERQKRCGVIVEVDMTSCFSGPLRLNFLASEANSCSFCTVDTRNNHRVPASNQNGSDVRVRLSSSATLETCSQVCSEPTQENVVVLAVTTG